MKDYSIGIKTGDGLFFPIMKESFTGRKRLVLTTVNDNQASVQIDFYKSLEDKIEGAEYIGSLVIENIEPSPSRGPEIEVILGVDAQKSLHAEAKNLASDEKQSLTVSLESLEPDNTYAMPEFELEDQLAPEDLFEDNQNFDSTLVGDAYPMGQEDRRKTHLENKKTSPLGAILLIIAGLMVVIGCSFLIFSLINEGVKNQGLPDGAPVETPGATEKPVATPLAVQTPVSTEKSSEIIKDDASEILPAAITPEETPAVLTLETSEIVVHATPVPVKNETDTAFESAEPKKTSRKMGGFVYTIKKGDTLWDLAELYYDDPWYAYKIYQVNLKKIAYPDLIIVGREIYLPEK